MLHLDDHLTPGVQRSPDLARARRGQAGADRAGWLELPALTTRDLDRAQAHLTFGIEADDLKLFILSQESRNIRGAPAFPLYSTRRRKWIDDDNIASRARGAGLARTEFRRDCASWRGQKLQILSGGDFAIMTSKLALRRGSSAVAGFPKLEIEEQAAVAVAVAEAFGALRGAAELTATQAAPALRQAGLRSDGARRLHRRRAGHPCASRVARRHPQHGWLTSSRVGWMK
ncbi:hypothetical protein IHQ68_13795 [Chelatococcus sambhunathii]|uniref:Uncharacterized protein n=1 Tax=Chelatococcus sambhunathii TaxID=363953 RepID=A0ABU1DHT0_9HYPH|nr:hypothetical protein [Chelatococcus sambhunathii]MDR4307691.1 hypothetical protein [Chelatococcus sambhunathii]